MLEISRRLLSPDERATIERQKVVEGGRFRDGLDAGLVLGLFLACLLAVWFIRESPLAGALTLAFMGLFLCLMLRNAYRRLRGNRERAAAKWDPILRGALVDEIDAEVVAARRMDDIGSETAWFLDVGDNRILVVWTWDEEPRSHIRVVQTVDAELALTVDWTGNGILPAAPRRMFESGEYRPRQSEVLTGTIHSLDDILRTMGRKSRPRVEAATPPRQSRRSVKSDKGRMALADAVEPAGFYKFTPTEEIAAVKAEITNGLEKWLRAAGRLFDADAERLAEGGVRDLLDYLRPLLDREGVRLASMEDRFDADEGYTIVINGREYTLWTKAEAKDSWLLTSKRVLDLVNGLLVASGSNERVYHLAGGGEDAQIVLLTPETRKEIFLSGVFPKQTPLPGTFNE